MAEKLTTDFTREEFECKCGCGSNKINLALVHKLQDIRNYVGSPLVVRSGLRCAAQNLAEGGVSESAHMSGLAVDIEVMGSRMRYLLINAAIRYDIDRIGIGKSFIHIDVDPDKNPDVVWLYT